MKGHGGSLARFQHVRRSPRSRRWDRSSCAADRATPPKRCCGPPTATVTVAARGTPSPRSGGGRAGRTPAHLVGLHHHDRQPSDREGSRDDRIPVVCSYGGRSPDFMVRCTRSLAAAIREPGHIGSKGPPTQPLRCNARLRAADQRHRTKGIERAVMAEACLLDRLTASDLFLLMWDDYGWSTDIGGLAIVEGTGLLDRDGRVRIEDVRRLVERRLHRSLGSGSCFAGPGWGWAGHCGSTLPPSTSRTTSGCIR